jgi:hypothetical protein
MTVGMRDDHVAIALVIRPMEAANLQLLHHPTNTNVFKN